MGHAPDRESKKQNNNQPSMFIVQVAAVSCATSMGAGEGIELPIDSPPERAARSYYDFDEDGLPTGGILLERDSS
jgi:hypothetical protein